MLTSPNAREPFQSARAIWRAVQSARPVNRKKPNSQTLGCRCSLARPAWGLVVGSWSLTRASCSQLAFGLEPVLEILAVPTSTLKISVVCDLGDFLVARRV